MVEVLESGTRSPGPLSNFDGLVSPERLDDICLDFFDGMFKPPIDRVHHDRDENFAFVLRQEPLDKRIGNAGKAKRIDQCKRRRDLAAGAVEIIEDFAELVGEGAAINLYLEGGGELAESWASSCCSASSGLSPTARRGHRLVEAASSSSDGKNGARLPRYTGRRGFLDMYT